MSPVNIVHYTPGKTGISDSSELIYQVSEKNNDITNNQSEGISIDKIFSSFLQILHDIIKTSSNSHTA